MRLSDGREPRYKGDFNCHFLDHVSMMNALNRVQVEADVAVPHFETTPPHVQKKE